MGLETGTYINDLNESWPVGDTDPKAQGDDHLRLIKKTLKNTFPNINGAITATDEVLNSLSGTGSPAGVLGAYLEWDGTRPRWKPVPGSTGSLLLKSSTGRIVNDSNLTWATAATRLNAPVIRATSLIEFNEITSLNLTPTSVKVNATSSSGKDYNWTWNSFNGMSHIFTTGGTGIDNGRITSSTTSLDITTSAASNSVDVRLISNADILIHGLVYPSSDGTNGQVLQTDGAGNLSFGSIGTSLVGLTDTNIGSPTTGDVLTYNGTEWTPQASTSATFTGLTDTTFTGLAAGDLAYYNGSAWVNLGTGTANQVLTVGSPTTNLIWSTNPGNWITAADLPPTGSPASHVEKLELSSIVGSPGGTYTISSADFDKKNETNATTIVVPGGVLETGRTVNLWLNSTATITSTGSPNLDFAAGAGSPNASIAKGWLTLYNTGTSTKVQ